MKEIKAEGAHAEDTNVKKSEFIEIFSKNIIYYISSSAYGFHIYTL